MQAAPELLEASIVASVFALGARGIPEGASDVVGGPRALLRAVTLREIATPLLVMSVLAVLHLPAAAAVGLTLLTVSPGTPVTLQRGPQAIGRSPHVALTSMMGVVLSIVSMPFWLALISKVFIENASVEPLEVARLAGVLFLLPFVVGMILRRSAPGAMRRIGVGFAGTAILLSLIALFVGHVAGGRRATDRSAVAFLCASRQPALALLIAESNFAGDLVLPAVVASFVIGTAISSSYAYWQYARADAPSPRTESSPADAAAFAKVPGPAVVP